MINKSVNGYTILSRLGEGGMAEVYYAENKIHKKAAVKFLKKEFCFNQNIVERFRNEAEVMVALDHPNIRQVFDYAELDGQPAIIMEYLEGDDLKSLIKGGRRFSGAEVTRLWDSLCDALNYTHAKGVVHRDIKPSNIFITNKGVVKLLDFGIAKVKDAMSGTQTGQKMGTLLYMSPEQIKDTKRVDYRTDVYSLAVTFVHLFRGAVPYDETKSSEWEIMNKIVSEPLDMTGVPGEWRVFLSPYLAKNPADRPALVHFGGGAVASDGPSNGKSHDFEGTIVENARQPKLKPEPEPEPKFEPTPQPKPKRNLAWLWVLLAVAVYNCFSMTNLHRILSLIVASVLGGVAFGVNSYMQRKRIAADSTVKGKGSECQRQMKMPLAPQPKSKRNLTWLWVLLGVLVLDRVVFGVIDMVIDMKNKRERTVAERESYERRKGFEYKTFTVNGVSFEMVAVKGGTFTMGATSEQGSDAWDKEKPTHSVTLGDYYIGKFEVTQELWEAVMGSNPSRFKGSRNPVERVSWDDCQSFIRKLNQLTGMNFRLPTEAEWEYAVRGGNKSRGYKYSGSNNINDVAWYYDNSGSNTHAVGTKSPNELGIYDMSGNVCEWCQDWYGDYSSGSQTNPTGPSSGSSRVLRGGGWGSLAGGCRVSDRGSFAPDGRGSLIGFRLVLVL